MSGSLDRARAERRGFTPRSAVLGQAPAHEQGRPIIRLQNCRDPLRAGPLAAARLTKCRRLLRFMTRTSALSRLGRSGPWQGRRICPHAGLEFDLKAQWPNEQPKPYFKGVGMGFLRPLPFCRSIRPWATSERPILPASGEPGANPSLLARSWSEVTIWRPQMRLSRAGYACRHVCVMLTARRRRKWRIMEACPKVVELQQREAQGLAASEEPAPLTPTKA